VDDFGAFFENLERTLEESPSAGELRDVRDILDDPSYEAELARFIAGINDPDVLGDFLARMRRLRRRMEERCEKRKLQKEIVVQMGVVGGVGLIGGSIIAAASATFPPNRPNCCGGRGMDGPPGLSWCLKA
jgi:hypothetical protein